MPFLTHPIAAPAPFVRSVAIAALLSSTMLATPLTAACAQVVTPQKQAAAETPQTKGETVEQRITALHASLQITADEEKTWNGVAQAMRENATAMDKLIAEKRASPPPNMSAVDDLKTYQLYAQAHVDGLKNLTAAFSTLYDTMPDAQKKVADQVFQASGHGTPASKG